MLCPDKSTVTNLICTGGRQQQDWSAAYRLYSRDRVDEKRLFQEVREQILAHLPAEEPLNVAMDDTLLRKRGTHIHGVAWRRDPLGPPFQTNLVRAQRFLQFSAAWPLEGGETRLLPIGFFHAPSATKPPKEANDQQRQLYREAQRQQNLNRQALAQMRQLRADCPATRALIFNGDGSYTNETVLKGLPAQSTYIGRIRKDASLYELPSGPPAATGRRPSYGALAPTPEALRTDDQHPWQEVTAFAAGRQHTFRVKTIGPVFWRKSGAARPLRVVVIAPLGYRLKVGGRVLYRLPAFLICTDPDMPLEQLLQRYLSRWGIEVNFREEKSLLGAGEAQVRTKASNLHFPAVVVAAYAFLWLSALRLHERDTPAPSLQPPKWRQGLRAAATLPSTGDLLRTLRFEVWSGALRPASFYDFVTGSPPDAKWEKPSPSLPGALFATA